MTTAERLTLAGLIRTTVQLAFYTLLGFALVVVASVTP